MPTIAILSSSVRTGRASHRVALYLKKAIEERQLGTPDIIDLNEYQFPVFNERLKYLENPSEQLLDYARRIKAADGVIIVTHEYNGGYPAALKNAIDVLYDEWRRKPIAIATVSDGIFGGTQVITSLSFSLFKIRAWLVPAMFPTPKVKEAFDEEGEPSDKAAVDKRAAMFLEELMWCIEAKKRMENADSADS